MLFVSSLRNHCEEPKGAHADRLNVKARGWYYVDSSAKVPSQQPASTTRHVNEDVYIF